MSCAVLPLLPLQMGIVGEVRETGAKLAHSLLHNFSLP